MKLPRRQFLHLASGAVALPAVSRIARAQTYPTKPVRLIVPFAPGGASDITARLMGQWLSVRFGQQFVIENRSGAGGNIGTEAVVHAPADGYTLLLATNANAIKPALYETLNFNFIRDIAPVASVYRGWNVMEVNPLFPAKTAEEFIAYAKANPGKITMASSGIGSGLHIYGELFKLMAGVNMVHVPYRGEGPAVSDLIGGQVQVMFGSVAGSIAFIRGGMLRPLAVTSATRLEALPHIPTIGEFLPGYEATTWFGVVAPRNTPAEIIDKLNTEINAGLADHKMKARFADLGATVFPGSPSEFGKLIAADTEKWGKVIRAANIKAE